MYVSGRRLSVCAPRARKQSARWSVLPEYLARAVLLACGLLALGAGSAPGYARAATDTPKIVFTAPVYAGQNNGFAEGPVGTSVAVRGTGWMPAGSVDVGPVTISLVDMDNDTEGSPGSACQNGAPQIVLPLVDSTIATDSTGTFTSAFDWPPEAGEAGHSYWACGTQGDMTSAGVDYFTVLSPNPPSVLITATQAAPGSMLTVTGRNWLPGGVQVNILIAPCVACQPAFSSKTQVPSQPDGSFSVQARVPADAPLGTTLYVSAQDSDPNNPNNDKRLSAGYSLLTNFTVAAAQESTPVPTVSPTPTAISPAPVGNVNGSENNDATISVSVTAFVVLLVLVGIVLASLVVTIVLLYLRLRRQEAEILAKKRGT
jgi:hypothetical protein